MVASVKHKWIGLLHVRPQSQASPLSYGAAGAYGNVVALAFSEANYRDLVEKALNADGIVVVEWEDVGTEDDYIRQNKLSPYLEGLLAALSDHQPIQLHTFYNYGQDDA